MTSGNAAAAPDSVFVADSPADLASADAFGHLDYAKAIAGGLADAPVPFTFGLFGAWGVGKTSIINAIHDELKQRKCAFVSFDVWRYEGDALRRSFLKDIARQLKDSGCFKWSYDPEKELRDLDVDVAVPEEKLKFSTRNLVVAATVALFTGTIAFGLFHFRFGSRLQIDVESKDITADIFFSVILAGLTFIGALFNRVFRVEQRVAALRHIEEPERFLEKFNQLLKAVKRERLVVAVDNLDRCSPDLADRMLSTIKTYLEPTSPAGDDGAKAVFLIAVDDAALRRHLVARELEATSAVPGLARDDGAAASEDVHEERDSAGEALHLAEEYVDEYLRKFFSATLRIKSLLDEEMRAYVGDQLSEFIAVYNLTEGEAEQITTMVASALRQNPRRVKQFVNNLEARIRLIRAREDSGMIVAGATRRLSKDILPIAKLAIIEEEWRDRYADLEANPRRLGEWQNAVVAGGEIDEEDRTFAAFLRTTRDIAIDEIYALLRLRQTSAERQLPDYSRFRESVALGALPEAAEIVQQADEEKRPEYLRRLLDIFKDEVARGSLQGARNALDAALGPSALGAAEATQRQILQEALMVQSLRESLWRLDARGVFEMLPLLPPSDRKLAIEPFLRLDSIVSEAPDRLEPTAEALAGISNELEASHLATLRTALATPGVLARYGDYLSVVRARPDLLSEGHVRQAYNDLTEQGAPIKIPSHQADVVALGLQAGLSPDIGDSLLEQLPPVINAATGSAEAMEQALAAVTEVVSEIPQFSDTAVQQVLSTMQSHFPTWASASPRAPSAMAQLAASIADRATARSGDTDSLVGWFINSLFEQHPVAGVEYAEGLGDAVPASARPYIVDRLVQVIQATPEEDLAQRAAHSLLGVAPGDGATHLQGALANLISRSVFARAATLISEFEKDVSNSSQLIEAFVAAIEAMAPTDRVPAVKELPAISSFLNDEQVRRVKDVLGEMLISAHEDPIEAGISGAEALRKEGFDDEHRELVRAAARHLTTTDYDADETDLVRWVATNGERLDAAERGALISQIRRWFSDGEADSAALAGALARFKGLTNDQRDELVQSLVEAEAATEDVAARLELLLAADTVKLKTRRAAKRLNERLDTLRSSGDAADQEVIAAFDERRDNLPPA